MNGIDGVDITEREGKAVNDQKYMFYCMQVYEFEEAVFQGYTGLEISRETNTSTAVKETLS